MAMISLQQVGKVYPRGTRPALDNIDLTIDRGDFVFLVGASGSGKTTLLSLLLREEEATSGQIRVAGNDLRRMSNRQVPQYRRSIGFIFQDYKLLANKTVWQNVAFALEVIGTSRATIRTLVPRVLETVGLSGKEKSFPHELSGGEQQRVAIARAYVNHPQIILADEPTGNLDPTTSLGIMEVLDAINRTGTTIVMATHNEEIVNSMRKRVVELHMGKIVRDERNGSYDSALYFPDGETQSAAHSAIDTGVSSVIGQETSGSEGIARLAQSVHSGRTGRYGEAFAPVETTLTWGKGVLLQDSEQSAETKGEAAAGTSTDEQSTGEPPVVQQQQVEQSSADQPTQTQQSANAEQNEQSEMSEQTVETDQLAETEAAVVSEQETKSSESSTEQPAGNELTENESESNQSAANEAEHRSVPAMPPAPPQPPVPPQQ